MLDRRTSLAMCVVGLLATSCAVSREAELSREMARQVGTNWLGVYFFGKKCGYSRMTISRTGAEGEGGYRFEMVLKLSVTMGLKPQQVAVREDRYYRATGELVRAEATLDSELGKAVMLGEVQGDELVLTTRMAGHTTRRRLAAPKESLQSLLAADRLIRRGVVGRSVRFELFEPMVAKTVKVVSTLVRFEDRLLGGVKTRVGVVSSESPELGMASTEYVTAEGELIETRTGAFLTLRREPEHIARNVEAAFDVLRAAIIPVKKRLGKPQLVRRLTLRVSGVGEPRLLIDDARQTYRRGEAGRAAWHTVTVTGARAPATVASLPLVLGPAEAGVRKWLEPSPFAQSDAPEIRRMAKRLVGEGTDSYAAARRIGRWVFKNVRKKGLAALSNALAVLQQREGDCSEHSILFVALCRAAGIPARQAVGIGYSDTLGGFGYHAWAEVYVGEWVAMDPTWGEDLADATHVKLAVGEPGEQTVIGGVLGLLRLEVVDFEAGPR